MEILYSGHSLSWWMDSYWENATANPRTSDSAALEYVASEAICKLRDLPECKPAMDAALALVPCTVKYVQYMHGWRGRHLIGS